MKKCLRTTALGFLLLGSSLFVATGLFPPDQWDASTQLWQNARQSMPVRRSLYEHRLILWPVGSASLALSAMLGWIGKEPKAPRFPAAPAAWNRPP